MSVFRVGDLVHDHYGYGIVLGFQGEINNLEMLVCYLSGNYRGDKHWVGPGEWRDLKSFSKVQSRAEMVEEYLQMT